MIIGDWVQVSITVVLVCITGWYAWETRQIVRNMERDRETMHRPVLAFQLVSWEARLLKLRIVNIGAGAAVEVDGIVTSTNKSEAATFPWSYPLLCAGQYEEFGFPMPQGASNEDRFQLDKIRENVVSVTAQFTYKSSGGAAYELNESIPIGKITDDWVASRMLVTQDHPNRIMPRIAKTLEKIDDHLRNLNR